MLAVLCGAPLAALAAGKMQMVLRRQDLSYSGLTAVLVAHKTLIDQQQNMIESLRSQLKEIEDDCHSQLDAMAREMRGKEDECARKLTSLGEEMRRQGAMYSRRIDELERRHDNFTRGRPHD